MTADRKSLVDGRINTFAHRLSLLPESFAFDKEAFKAWFRSQLEAEKPDKLVIDAFPGGILGELCDLPELENIKIEYIARILKVEAYKKRLTGNLPHVDKIWHIEPIASDQEAWLKTMGAPIERLNLKYPVPIEHLNISFSENTWLIVHSGSESELFQLWEYAKDSALLEGNKPAYAVVGQCNRPDFLPSFVPYYIEYPVTHLLLKAAKVISAAGFNMMKQMDDMRVKHLVLPFVRPLDDQFIRLKLRRQVTALS